MRTAINSITQLKVENSAILGSLPLAFALTAETFAISQNGLVEEKKKV
jgi:hypothetical protein